MLLRLSSTRRTIIFIALLAHVITANPTPHVCVIGAGIAGATVAHFLSFDPAPEVTVFDRADDVGGRVRSLYVPGAPPIEAGASIIADGNELMGYYVRLLNLTKKRPSGSLMGLWDGSGFVFRERSSSVVTAAVALARYRRSPFRAQKFIADLLEKYRRLYPHSGAGGVWEAYPSVRALLKRVELYDLSQDHFGKLAAERFSARYINEILAAITRVNYGQEVSEMNALVGAVALAGSGDTLWAVEGGNQQVIDGLLRKASSAQLRLRAAVLGVRRIDNRYELEVRENEKAKTVVCDAVVLAAPSEQSNIDLPGDIAQRLDVGRSFQRTVATFLRGGLNTVTFGSNTPKMVLTTAGAKENFTSVNEVAPGVYKVFSKIPMDSNVIDRVFAPGAEVITTYDWLAYPKFAPPERFADFDCDGNGAFFYTSPLESAGSAMEMSAVAGANVAALVRERLGLIRLRNEKKTNEKEEL